MAVTETDFGTQSCTLGTEHSLVTKSAEGVYQLIVEPVSFAWTDWLEVRVKYESQVDDGSRVEEECWTIGGAVTQPFRTPPFACPTNGSIEFTFKMPNTSPNVARSVKWALLDLQA